MSGDPRVNALKEIYKRVPKIKCKGLCWNSCGPIEMSVAEHKRIHNLGVDIPVFTPERAQAWAANLRRVGEVNLLCPALTDDRRCSVYEARPLICRLWGVTESMPCTHGCEVLGTPVSDHEAYKMIASSLRIGGPQQSPEDIVEAARELRLIDAMMTDPVLSPLMKRFIAGERGLDEEIKRHIDRLRETV